jgi:hypothetical protein
MNGMGGGTWGANHTWRSPLEEWVRRQLPSALVGQNTRARDFSSIQVPQNLVLLRPPLALIDEKRLKRWNVCEGRHKEKTNVGPTLLTVSWRKIFGIIQAVWRTGTSCLGAPTHRALSGG